MEQQNQKICPYCGVALPDNSTFCPYCAKNIHPRSTAAVPVPLRKKVFMTFCLLAAVVAVWLIWFWSTRPETYDGQGEVFYTAGQTTYQVVLAYPYNPCQPVYTVHQDGEPDEPYRWPSRLYINYKDTGADASAEFMTLVEHVSTEILQGENNPSPMTATVPAHDDYSPDAAMVSYLDFTGSTGTTQVIWTIHMKNGDKVLVRQDQIITPIPTRIYHYQDYPMTTLEELQALVTQIDKEVDPDTIVKLYLPPVTYGGTLELNGHSLNLYGCTDGTGRTVFRGGIQVTNIEANGLNYFYDIDFLGSGRGIGASISSKSWLTGCSFTDFKTGVLAYGTAWVNLTDCRFEHNEVGFHFNSTGQSASDDYFENNQFIQNDTAILLEQVPTDMILYFDGSLFRGNGLDIDNRCQHPLDTSQATFS